MLAIFLSIVAQIQIQYTQIQYPPIHPNDKYLFGDMEKQVNVEYYKSLYFDENKLKEILDKFDFYHVSIDKESWLEYVKIVRATWRDLKSAYDDSDSYGYDVIALERLRKMLGNEAYYSGSMPLIQPLVELEAVANNLN